MNYGTILELQLTHPFYADGQCPDVAIDPAADTLRLLGAHRLLVRSRPGSVVLASPLDAAGGPAVPLPAGAALRFELRIANDDFALFTELSAIAGTPSPVFTNAHMDPVATGALALTSRMTRDPVTGADVPAKQAPGILAEVEIVLHPEGTIGRAIPAAIFQTAFSSRQWRWAYYCITDLPAGGGTLSIIDASASGTPGALAFNDANRTELDMHPDPLDPIAVQIATRHPGLRCVRFVSDQPVACREWPRQPLELRLDGLRVTSPLPNPAVRSFTRRKLPPPTPTSEDLLFQIIEYRVQPFSNL